MARSRQPAIGRSRDGRLSIQIRRRLVGGTDAEDGRLIERAATTCMPSGSPLLENPVGNAPAPGFPVTFNGMVCSVILGGASVGNSSRRGGATCRSR